MVPGLENRKYVLMVSHNDYSRGSRTFAAGTSDAEIVLKGKGSIEGRVVNAKTGAPLPVYKLNHVIGAVRRLSDFGAGIGKTVESGDGALRIPQLWAEYISVVVKIAGFSPEMSVVQVEEGAATWVEFRLHPVAPVDEIVVSADGDAIPYAYLYYKDRMVMLDFIDRIAAARTDDAGHFVLDSLPQDIKRLFAYAEGHGVGVADLPGDGRIVLTVPGTVEGVVQVADRTSFGDVSVNVYNVDAGYLPHVSERLNADGTFRFTGLTPGRMTVRARFGGVDAQNVLRTVVIESGKIADLELVIQGGTGVLAGMLYGLVDEGWAYLKLERGQGDWVEALQAQPDSEGNYRFEKVWGGDLVLKITRVYSNNPGELVKEELAITLGEGETLQQDIELEPLP